jgi:integrase
VRGRWFSYHRKTGIRLKAEFGTGAFFAELAAIERNLKTTETSPGSLGHLFSAYRSSERFTDLASATKQGYERMMNLLRPINDMPLADLTPQFIAGLRDRMAVKHGRRQANYVMAVISVACEFGRELGIVSDNPVKGVRRLRRSRDAPKANRPWTAHERRTVLAELPVQLRIPVALAMFTGLRKSDVLALPKSAIRAGRIRHKTSKTGQEVFLPLHPDLARLLSRAPSHNATTICATTQGTPWTVSGFNASFIKAVAKLVRSGKVSAGLTFHGVRHSVGHLLIEAGVELDTVRRWLGQKTLAMAIHYSETADTSEQLRDALKKFDPLGSKAGTKVSNATKKVSNKPK